MAQQDRITKTRLLPPHFAVKILPRPHLITRVKSALADNPLTLISAPAGSGKTTLILQAVREIGKLPIAWLRLSEEDNDPRVFYYALFLAWRRVLGQPFQNALNLLENFSEAPRRNAVMAILINELMKTAHPQLILILDDFHLIRNEEIHQAIAHLLDNAPANLRIAMTTRFDPPLPLASLRVRGQLAEFRLNDLRFDAKEVQAYFDQLWHIVITPSEGQRIYEQTGGWVASLHLLALNVRDLHNDSFKSGSMDKVTGSNQHVYQLLAEEVLGHQPEELQQFLLETSILSELTPRICRIVTGNPQAGKLLEMACQRNLFLMPIENKIAYRYHDLFAEFLQHQLAEKHPGQIQKLHRRAAEAVDDPTEKIRHYIAAERWQEAAIVLEQEGLTLLAHGYNHLLQRWISMLPLSLVKCNPSLRYLLGTTALKKGDFSTAEEHLQQALAGYRSRQNEAAEGQVLLMLANLASSLHQNQRTFSYLQQALSKPLSPHQKVQAHITSAWMHVYAGNLRSKAHEDLKQALRITKMNADPLSMDILGHQLRAPLLFSPLGIAPLEHYSRQVLNRFGQTTAPPTLGALCLLNIILLLRGDLAEAQQLRHRAQTMNELLGQPVYITIALDLSELLDALFRSDFRQFETFWHKRIPVYEQTQGLQQWLVSFLFFRGLLLFFKGKTDQAGHILEQMRQELLSDDLPENRLAADTLEGILLMDQAQWVSAEERLRKAVAIFEQSPHGLLFANPSVWLAHLYRKQGRENQARKVLEMFFAQFRLKEMGALLLRERGIIVPLLELMKPNAAVLHILRLFEKTQNRRATSIPNTVESLTKREMEVLRLLSRGARNQEIAEALFITVRTVKAHVSNIMAKMCVQSRTQAVAKAHQLEIL